MKRSIIIVLHLAYWVVYTFLTISTLIIAGSDFKGSPYLSFFLNGFLAVSCFYTFYFFLVPRLLASRKIRLFALYSVITCITASITILLANALFHYQEPTEITTSPSILPMVLNWIMIITFHFLVGLTHGLLVKFFCRNLVRPQQTHIASGRGLGLDLIKEDSYNSEVNYDVGTPQGI